MLCLGCVRACVIVDSSRARTMPSIVAMMAAVFVGVGMVMGRVFVGVMYDVMSRPTRMLPKARRVRGLVIMGLFSFIGGFVDVRGNLVWTNNVIRRL